MLTPLLFQDLAAHRQDELLTEACWHRAWLRNRPARRTARSRVRPLAGLSRLLDRAALSPQPCCA